MKKNIIIALVSVFCFACNDGKLDERKLDATGDKLDAAGEKLKKTVEKGADSAEAKLKRLKKRIDTTRRDTSRL